MVILTGISCLVNTALVWYLQCSWFDSDHQSFNFFCFQIYPKISKVILLKNGLLRRTMLMGKNNSRLGKILFPCTNQIIILLLRINSTSASRLCIVISPPYPVHRVPEFPRAEAKKNASQKPVLGNDRSLITEAPGLSLLLGLVSVQILIIVFL